MEDISRHNQLKTKLLSTFKKCLDILRDSTDILSGEKALRNMAYLIVIKLLEPRFGKEIDIDGYDYHFEDYDPSNVEKYKSKLLTSVRFSNLCKEPEENISNILKCLWDDILSVHPITRNIFIKNKGFDIHSDKTFSMLISRINGINFECIEEDILGEAYEEVIKDVMKGKILGQFFTPPVVKHLMMDLVNPQMHLDGTCETIFDPAMGTGGFLISAWRHLHRDAKSRNIKINWDFIKKHGLGGREADLDTFQLGLSNMLITTGHIFDTIQRGDSIRNPIRQSYDIILANPPFGIDGLIYSEIKDEFRDTYLPIKSNNAVSLFLQAIISILRINGRCAIVVPEGKELFNKGKDMVALREYLMKTCDLKEVIYLPSGIFTHTNTKTCVLYFYKKREGSEIVEFKNKIKSTQDFTRTYKFKNENQTTQVSFYDFDPIQNTKNLLIQVPVDKIASCHYSLNHVMYLKSENIEGNGVIMKPLGEFCSVIKGVKKSSKEGKETGLYPLYYCSILGNLYLDTYDYSEEGIIINKTNGSGKSMVYYGFGKYNVGKTTIHFKSNSKDMLTKFIYYYLLNNLELIQQYYKGSNQKSILEEDLFLIRIPVFPLEKQKSVVREMDILVEKNNEMRKQIQEHEKYMENYMKSMTSV
jgi:type I restriction enzyme M protein